MEKSFTDDLAATAEAVERSSMIDPSHKRQVIASLHEFAGNPGSMKWLQDLKQTNLFLEVDVWFKEYGVEASVNAPQIAAVI